MRFEGANAKPYSLATVMWSCRVRFFIACVIVQINGEKKEVAAGTSVAQLLEQLGIRPGRVVVELNRDVVARDAHGRTVLQEGDAVEIVHFVGGG